MVRNISLLMKFMVFQTSAYIISVSYHKPQTGYLPCNGPVQSPEKNYFQVDGGILKIKSYSIHYTYLSISPYCMAPIAAHDMKGEGFP